jgi:hypothetical protein
MENFTEKREEEHAGCDSTSVGVGQQSCLTPQNHLPADATN